jgi:hypothetical protein
MKTTLSRQIDDKYLTNGRQTRHADKQKTTRHYNTLEGVVVVVFVVLV